MTGLPLGWLLLGLALFLAGLFVVVFGKREEDTVGQHSWLDEDDLEPDGDDTAPDGDERFLAAVTGIGDTQEPGEQAQATAAQMDPGEWPDLRGDRDRDQHAAHPWRTT